MRKKGEKKRNKKRIVSSIAIDPFRFFSNQRRTGNERKIQKERERERKDCSSLRVHRSHRFLDPSSFFPLSRRKRNTDRSFRTVFALSKRAARFLSRRENRSGIHVLVIGNESKSQGSGTIESHEQKEN